MTSQTDEALEGKVRSIYLWSTLVCDVWCFSVLISGTRSHTCIVQEDGNLDVGKPEDASVAVADRGDPETTIGGAQAENAAQAEAHSPQDEESSEGVPAAHSSAAAAPDQNMVEKSGHLNGAADQLNTVKETANEKVRSKSNTSIRACFLEMCFHGVDGGVRAAPSADQVCH